MKSDDSLKKTDQKGSTGSENTVAVDLDVD